MAAMIEVSQHWGESLLRVERFPATRRLTVGPAAKSDFVAALDQPTVLIDGGAVHGNEGSVDLEPGTDVEVGVGDVIFRVRTVEPERPVPGAIRVDWMFAAALLLAALFTLATMVIAVLTFFAIFVLRMLVAFVFALIGHDGVPLWIPMTPPPMPPPVAVSATFTPPEPPPPARPFFVRATPAPVPTLAPIAIGDQPLTRYAVKGPSRSVKAELLAQ